jgi:hypothetical protein
MNTAAFFESLGQKLYTMRESGVIVPHEMRVLGDWTPSAKDCHVNAGYWAESNLGTSVVRGWFYFHFNQMLGYVNFVAHSMIRESDGRLLDLTPRQTFEDYPFIVHPGSIEEFDALVNSGVTNFNYIPADW